MLQPLANRSTQKRVTRCDLQTRPFPMSAATRRGIAYPSVLQPDFACRGAALMILRLSRFFGSPLPCLRAFPALLRSGASLARAAETAPKPPPIPPVVSLSVQPATLTLEDSRDTRAVIVTGRTKAGY